MENIDVDVTIIKKVRLFRYTPCRRLRGEKEKLLLVLDLGTRWR